MKIRILVLLICGLSVQLMAQDWQFRKSSNDIKVYFRESSDSKIKELKITCQVKSSLAGAVTVISDATKFSEWVYECKEAKVLEGESMKDFVYYNLTDFPWPLSNREFILRCTTYQDAKTLVVYSMASAEPKVLPMDKRYVRVQLVQSNWTLKPMGNGLVQVEYYLKSDPGGNIPVWMVNLALDIGPLKSLKKFKERVESEQYKKMRIDFIKEP